MILKTLSLLAALTAALAGLALHHLLQVPDLPKLDPHKLWGPATDDASIRKFRIDFNDSMIKDLRDRLANKRPLTKPLEGINSEYGINTVYLEEILEYWGNKYDFKKRADLLNQFDHYKTRIQGLDLHFIWQKPSKTDGLKVLPILLLHGWPSSSKEFVKIIPTLTTPRKGQDFVFEVVSVDLPGFGFSEGTSKPGLNPAEMGVMMHNLMKRLGYNQYYVQGGDWGSQVASHMATLFQEDVLGIHLNLPLSTLPISNFKILVGAIYPPLLVEDKYRDRMYPLSKIFNFCMRESGYFHIQATKPDTVGVGLTDSPAGLAAYLIEKMAVISNNEQLDTPHGGITALDRDDVLDTITIVWANNCIVTSSRIYAESLDQNTVGVLKKIPSYVPAAAIKFKHEIIYHPDSIIRDKFPNLVHSTTLDFGGHFAGLHTPKEFADDILDATAEFLKFHAKKSK